MGDVRPSPNPDDVLATALRAKHVQTPPGPDDYCVEDGELWPCNVVRLLDRLAASEPVALDVEDEQSAIAAMRHVKDWLRDKLLHETERVSINSILREMDAAFSAPAAVPPSEPETLPRSEYARLQGVEDIAILIVEGWDHGFPVSDGDDERGLIARLRTALDQGAKT